MCVHWQWNTLEWCQLNALQASPVVHLVTPLSCVSLSMNTQPSVPTIGTTFFWLQITWHSRTTLYPVMVFIHGGEYLTGSAEVYPGHVMAKREVVVVTMSYRLGALGKHGVCHIIIPPKQRSCWGVYWFHSVRLSVRLSVRPSRLPCPLCNIYNSGWILSILATNDHYHERVCRTQWPLTLTYIFKVIRSSHRKSCPLCSVYSSGWIPFIFSTSDHYH